MRTRFPESLPHRLRRRVVAASIVTVIALVVAVTALVAGLQARGDREVPERYREAARAAAAATAELMTFAPDDAAPRRADVARHLTGALLADYEQWGPDAVLPGASAGGIAVTTRITGAATRELRDDRARVLVLFEQRFGSGGQVRDVAGGARWATVEDAGGTWRLARLEPVL